MESIIFDCDNTWGLKFKEIDDGLTLLYLLGRKDIQIMGITTSFGNGTIEEVMNSTGSLRNKVGHQEIPLLKGAEKPSDFHTPAAAFLAETADSFPGQLSLLATGPLGNLFAAQKIDSHFFTNLKQIVCMGGIQKPLQIGWRNLKELNFSVDPIATSEVLKAPCPITIMNAHTCLEASFNFLDLAKLSFWSGEARSIIRKWLLAFGIYCGKPCFYLWDLLPAVYLSSPDFFQPYSVKISSSLSDLEKGLIKSHYDSASNINMPATILEPKKFINEIFNAWKNIYI